jgi:hypothetical protein
MLANPAKTNIVNDEKKEGGGWNVGSPRMTAMIPNAKEAPTQGIESY